MLPWAEQLFGQDTTTVVLQFVPVYPDAQVQIPVEELHVPLCWNKYLYTKFKLKNILPWLEQLFGQVIVLQSIPKYPLFWILIIKDKKFVK